MTPSTVSGGQVAHHPTTPTLLPFFEAMFHTASVRRMALLTGCLDPSCGCSTVNEPMPCSSGVRPVAMVVHRIGLSMGRSLCRTP